MWHVMRLILTGANPPIIRVRTSRPCIHLPFKMGYVHLIVVGLTPLTVTQINGRDGAEHASSAVEDQPLRRSVSGPSQLGEEQPQPERERELNEVPQRTPHAEDEDSSALSEPPSPPPVARHPRRRATPTSPSSAPVRALRSSARTFSHVGFRVHACSRRSRPRNPHKSHHGQSPVPMHLRVLRPVRGPHRLLHPKRCSIWFYLFLVIDQCLTNIPAQGSSV